MAHKVRSAVLLLVHICSHLVTLAFSSQCLVNQLEITGLVGLLFSRNKSDQLYLVKSLIFFLFLETMFFVFAHATIMCFLVWLQLL